MLLRETNPLTQFVSSNQTTDSGNTEGLLMAGNTVPGQRSGNADVEQENKRDRELPCHKAIPINYSNGSQHVTGHIGGRECFPYNCIRFSFFFANRIPHLTMYLLLHQKSRCF